MGRSPPFGDDHCSRRYPRVVRALENHYGAFWGPPARTALFDKIGVSIAVWKWDATDRTGGVAMYATLGGSGSPAAGLATEHRYEYFVGLLPEQDDVAAGLALLCPYGWIHPLGDGHTVEVDGGLWPGSGMDCWLLAHPEEVVVPDLVQDGTHVQWLQEVPLFPAERTWKAVHGANNLWAHWQADEVPFWSPEREPWIERV